MITRYIEAKSTIHVDCYLSYLSLKKIEEYVYKCVRINNVKSYTNSFGNHTNRIDSLWGN